MMRVTPLRFTTLQCSQIGFTLVRTFTGAPLVVGLCIGTNEPRPSWPDPKSSRHTDFTQVSPRALATSAEPAFLALQRDDLRLPSPLVRRRHSPLAPRLHRLALKLVPDRELGHRPF